ncbi:HAD-IC family P-type ATPase [Rhodococcus spongiicola]|uniref:HAD family hydrolase n=1 Tax=Rhodococcus spongiicola TaxID=2487352 RepID=A0A438APM9_9NOCA|nr:HAD-IC family P-type ATPase [Rhodococcus spongiicola]RVW00888.1 HAD family hydrolase [Rhodococcus spongiicola]
MCAAFTSTTTHHELTPHEVVELLSTDARNGLGDKTAHERLAQFGPNTLPRPARAGLLMRWLRQFHNPLIYVLLVCGAVTMAIGEVVDSSVIFAVVIVNAVVGFVQESRAEAALEGLRALIRTEARVVRDGEVRSVPSERLVPGDLVVVEAGDRVPADLRMVTLTELSADESSLTGESAPVSKNEVALPPDTAVADRRNMLYSGTLVTSGTGSGIAVATGANTELGEIHRLVGAADTLATPLTRKLAWFSRVLTVAIVALAAVTFVAGLLRATEGTNTFTAAVALAVSAIPEGLPAAVTVTLAIGVGRMARRRAVVRRLPAVETLGSTTVVCSDKTGTLTENQMTVQTVWTPGLAVDVHGSGFAPVGEIVDASGTPVDPDQHPALRWTLLAGLLCNDASLRRSKDGQWSVVGDPTEGAMVAVAAKAGYDQNRTLADMPRTGSIPFSSDRCYMATRHTRPDGPPVVVVKGAVEQVLALCRGRMSGAGEVDPLAAEEILQATSDLADQGLRVLATAVRDDDPTDPADPDPDQLPGTLAFTGLQAMVDPPRASAADAVRACQRAGIAVKMITGDHAATAKAIAARIGLAPASPETDTASPKDNAASPKDNATLTGRDLAGMTDEELPEAANWASVFARVSPQQKLRLVEALQRQGHVTAMTGDGVNDAPALRRADIGIAMGRSGTEVAKDSADMVLTDDDFATIEAAVEEGRGVFDNLTKFIAWTLPTNVGQGGVILVAILGGLTLPILPVQILWINMTTALVLGLMLAFEPKERDIMERPPRDPDRPLLTSALTLRILLVSTVMVVGTWWLFQWELSMGAELAEARTAAVNLVVAVEIVYLFSCRSLTQSPWRLGFLTNRWVLIGVAVQVVAQAAITYLPSANLIFDTAPVGWETWIRVAAIAAVATAIVAVDKRLRRGSAV